MKDKHFIEVSNICLTITLSLVTLKVAHGVSLTNWRLGRCALNNCRTHFMCYLFNVVEPPRCARIGAQSPGLDELKHDEWVSCCLTGIILFSFFDFLLPFLNKSYDTYCFSILIDCVERKFDKILTFFVSCGCFETGKLNICDKICAENNVFE